MWCSVLFMFERLEGYCVLCWLLTLGVILYYYTYYTIISYYIIHILYIILYYTLIFFSSLPFPSQSLSSHLPLLFLIHSISSSLLFSPPPNPFLSQSSSSALSSFLPPLFPSLFILYVSVLTYGYLYYLQIFPIIQN